MNERGTEREKLPSSEANLLWRHRAKRYLLRWDNHILLQHEPIRIQSIRLNHSFLLPSCAILLRHFRSQICTIAYIVIPYSYNLAQYGQLLVPCIHARSPFNIPETDYTPQTPNSVHNTLPPTHSPPSLPKSPFATPDYHTQTPPFPCPKTADPT